MPAGRVELSGATAANWVGKTANLLVDGYGAPDRVGLLLPLHWQTVTLLLAGAAADATVVLAGDPGDLDGCAVAFVLPDDAAAALDAGVEDVLVLSGHPMGAPVPSPPPLTTDYAREVPAYADRFSGPRPPSARVLAGAVPLTAGPDLDLGPGDRVLTAVDLRAAARTGAGLLQPGLLAPLRAGAALVLVPEPQAVPDLAALARAEGVTATAGVTLTGLRRLDGPR